MRGGMPGEGNLLEQNTVGPERPGYSRADIGWDITVRHRPRYYACHRLAEEVLPVWHMAIYPSDEYRMFNKIKKTSIPKLLQWEENLKIFLPVVPGITTCVRMAVIPDGILVFFYKFVRMKMVDYAFKVHLDFTLHCYHLFHQSILFIKPYTICIFWDN